ncbi:hypothetical protein B0H10DRAFT_1942581 [Mycena sp. CBHHK59/15]|nr:hypothetical protein B0H10DRAFT_1942581 [Mycena sp. CBHHK59/15]
MWWGQDVTMHSSQTLVQFGDCSFDSQKAVFFELHLSPFLPLILAQTEQHTQIINMYHPAPTGNIHVDIDYCKPQKLRAQNPELSGPLLLQEARLCDLPPMAPSSPVTFSHSGSLSKVDNATFSILFANLVESPGNAEWKETHLDCVEDGDDMFRQFINLDYLPEEASLEVRLSNSLDLQLISTVEYLGEAVNILAQIYNNPFEKP